MRTRDTTRRFRALALIALALAGTAACDEANPFRTIPEEVRTGSSQLWELGLLGFPSGYDIPTETRFFVGPSSVLSSVGTFVLASRDDGTLVLRPYAPFAPGFSVVRTGIQDLGAVSFDAVVEVPEGGYTSSSDTLGVPVVEGHTYALRISIPSQGVVFINFAKLHVVDVGQQLPGDPGSRFILFEWAYQNQPLNRNVAAAIP
jgi:hypothetical protein